MQIIRHHNRINIGPASSIRLKINNVLKIEPVFEDVIDERCVFRIAVMYK